MNAAVAQFAVVQVGLLRTFARQLRNSRNRLTFLLAVHNLLLQNLCNVQILVQVIVNVCLDEVTHELVDAHARKGEGIALRIFIGRHDE